jgi:hypothetical protein
MEYIFLISKTYSEFLPWEIRFFPKKIENFLEILLCFKTLPDNKLSVRFEIQVINSHMRPTSSSSYPSLQGNEKAEIELPFHA